MPEILYKLTLFILANIPFLENPAEIDQAACNPLYHQAMQSWENMECTLYSNDGIVDKANGYYEINCSFFVWHLLENLFGTIEHQRLPVEEGIHYCRAVCFHDFFENLDDKDPVWSGVTNFRSVQVGDVIAWRVSEISLQKNSGHVVIAMESPEPTLERGDNWFKLQIIDSTKKPHFDDTRENHPGALEQGGLGIGTMFFELNEEGKVLQYHSRPSDPIRSNKSFAIGRMHCDLDLHLGVDDVPQCIPQDIEGDHREEN